MGERSGASVTCACACLHALCYAIAMLCMLCCAVPCCSVVPDWGVLAKQATNTCRKSLIPLVLCCAWTFSERDGCKSGPGARSHLCEL